MLYLLTGEEECNNNMKTFIDCIDAVKGKNDDGDDDDELSRVREWYFTLLSFFFFTDILQINVDELKY